MELRILIQVLKTVLENHQELTTLLYHQQKIHLNLFHATLRELASHQTDILHDMIVDKLLLGGASVIVLGQIVYHVSVIDSVDTC